MPRMLKAFAQRMFGFWPNTTIYPLTTGNGAMPVVLPSNALQYTPVYRAASLIANDVARARADITNDVAHILFREPNRYMSGFEFRRSLTLQAVLYGNAFALINRTMGGELLELIPLGVDTVSLDLSTNEPIYKTQAYGDIPTQSMLHIRALGIDGLWGESAARLCRTALTIMAAQENSQLESMRNAGNPKLALLHPGALSESARQRIAELYLSGHAGATNTGKPLVLADGMRVEKISSTMDDAGLTAARKYSIGDVSRIYGVPTHMLGDDTGKGYGSLEWAGRAYLDGCLSGWFAAWEAEIQRKLLGAGDAVSFDVDFIIRPSLAEQMAALRTGVESGIITRNEARDKLDLPPLDGLDDPIVAKNMGLGGGQTNIGDDTDKGMSNDFPP